MRRAHLVSVVLALALIAVAITVLAETNRGPALPSQEDAKVRVIHASPDAPPIDLLLDGSVIFTDAAFGDITNYTEVRTGTYTVTLQSHEDSLPILAETLIFTESDYTLVAADRVATLDLLKLVDDNSAPAPGMARGRLVHLSPGAPAVDVAIKDGPVLFSDVGFKEASHYVEIARGTYELEIRLAGTGIPVGTATLTVWPNNVYSAFAIGTPTNLQFVITLDKAHGHTLWLPLIVAAAD